MTIQTTALYAVWGLIPLYYLGVILWNYLEKVSGGAGKERTDDNVRQLVFTVAAFFVAVLVDSFALSAVVAFVSTSNDALWIARLALFPAVLLGGALLVGPSKEIRITKVTHVSKGPSGRKGRSRGK